MGKTFVSSKLISYLRTQGLRVLGIKPIETGVNPIAHDACIYLQQAQNLFPSFSLDEIVLYTFPLPASPFVADQREEIELERIFSYIAYFEGKVDVLLVEGAGGLFVPIKKDYFFLDFAHELQERFESEVIFVCDDRLGMINRLLGGWYVLRSRSIRHHFFINLRDEENFKKISLPFLQEGLLTYSTDIKNLATSLRVFE